MKAAIAHVVGCALLVAALAGRPLAWSLLALLAMTGALALAWRPVGARVLPLVIVLAVASILAWAPILAS